MTPPPIRVFALPLTRASKSTPGPIIYWHVSQSVPTTHSGQTSQTSPAKSVDWKRPSTWPPPRSWPSESVAKASDLWLSWGTRPTYETPGKKTLKERGVEWKYWTWTKGEALMDRVEWEEWALKSINPSVKVGQEIVATDESGVKSVQPSRGHTPSIPLLIPHHPSIDPSQTLVQLETYLSQRIPYHKKYMKQALALTPILLPFGLLPVVPNFPFLIAAWRCFSHYRAWKGAEWLLALVKDGKLEVRVDDELGAALRPVKPKSIEGKVGVDVDGPQSGVKEDHAPDETSTPDTLIQGEKGEQEEENAILQTRHILEEGTPTSPPAKTQTETETENRSGDKLDKMQSQAGSKSTSVPDPESQEVAPDATGTPASQIYTHKTGSDTSSSSSSSSTSTSNSTTKETNESDEPATLTMENIPRLTETFGLKASEVVDLTRAVMQIKDKADRAIEVEGK